MITQCSVYSDFLPILYYNDDDDDDNDDDNDTLRINWNYNPR